MSEETLLPDNLNIPKNIEKWINVEKKVYTINEKNIKEASSYIRKNFAIDPDAVLLMICNAYKNIPTHIKGLKLLFKDIGVVSQIFDNNTFTLELYKEGIIKEDLLENAPLFVFTKAFDIKEDSLFGRIAADDLDKVTILSSKKGFTDEKIIIPSIEGELYPIDFAALTGATRVFKFLFLNNSEITRETCSCAVRGGNEDIIQFIEEKGNTFNHNFFNAAISHNTDIAMWVFDNFNNGSNELKKYVDINNTEILLFVMSNMKEENSPNYRKQISEAIVEAVKIGNLPALLVLLENIEKNEFPYIYKLLHLAVSHHYLFIVKALVRFGLDVNEKNGEGDTPLIIAAKNNDVPIIKFLLDRNADINERNNEGETALIAAVKNDRFRATSCLISYGADKSIRDNAGKRADDYSGAIATLNLYN